MPSMPPYASITASFSWRRSSRLYGAMVGIDQPAGSARWLRETSLYVPASVNPACVEMGTKR